MTFALEIYLAMTFGVGAGWLLCALCTVSGRASDAEESRQRELRLEGSRDLNRTLTEENERLQAELSELNALRRDGGALRRHLQ
jgi:hypothetical protein